MSPEAMNPDVGAGHFVTFTVPYQPGMDISCRMDPHNPTQVQYEVQGLNDMHGQAFTRKTATAQSQDQLSQYVWQASEPVRLQQGGNEFGQQPNPAMGVSQMGDPDFGEVSQNGKVAERVGQQNGHPQGAIPLPAPSEPEADPDNEPIYTQMDVGKEVVITQERAFIRVLYGLLQMHMDQKDPGWKMVKGMENSYVEVCEQYGVPPLDNLGED